MAWTISDNFPEWGDTGQKPPTNKDYQGEEQVLDIHINYLWDKLDKLEDQIRSALTDIDSDGDGVVDVADSTNLYKGNDIDTDEDGTVNDAEDTYLYKSRDLDRETLYADVNSPVDASSLEYASITTLADGDTITVTEATFTAADGSTAPSGTALSIVAVTSGSTTLRQTVLSGGTHHIGVSDPASYTNTTGSEETIAIVIDNGVHSSGTGADENIHATATAHIA